MRTQRNIDTTPGPNISSKTDPNSTQHLPKIDPKSTQNQRKIVPKSAPGPTWAPRPFLNNFLTNFGSNLGPSWGPSWGHVGQKINFWKFPKARKKDYDFQHHSGPSWDRFWNDFEAQSRTTIGPRSVSRAIMKQMQRSSKSSAGAVFLRIRGLEHRSKFDQNRA